MERVILNASFEVVGNRISQVIGGCFNIVGGSIQKEVYEEGINSMGLRGTITKYNGFIHEVVPNAKVVALKNGVVYDYDTTREDGTYYLYLENGVYDIRIEGQAYNRVIKNYEVKNGIREYRQLIRNGQVKEKILDTVRYVEYDPNNRDRVFDDGQRLVVGKIIDEHGKPVVGAEILLARVFDIEESDDRPIKAFVKTDEQGKYMFVIDRENYDVVLRSPKHNAKVLRNYLFVPDKGFMTDISSTNIVFKKGGDWVWIFN